MVSMATPWKDPKTGMYGLRKGVPKDLRDIIGKSAIKKSYGTKDPQEAKRLHMVELPKAEALIENARAGSVSLTLKDKEALAGEWLQTALREDEYKRAKGDISPDEIDYREEDGPYGLNLDFVTDALQGEDSGNGDTFVLGDIKEALAQRSIPLTEAKIQDDRELVRCFLKVKHHYYQTLRHRSKGNWVEPDYSQYPEFTLNTQGRPKPTKGTSLEELWEPWSRETATIQKTQDEYRKAWDDFRKLHGTIAMQYITKEHIRKYKDKLIVEDQLSTGTINKRLSALKTLLKYATDNGYINMNPAEGITVVDKEASIDKRSPLDPDDLNAIFSSPIYKDGYRPKGGGGEAAFWIPLIALYTGARLNEIGRLKCSDIREHEGIYYFEFFNAQKGQRKRGSKSHPRKIVPVHSELINRDLVSYAQKTKRNENTPLFPLLKADRYESVTGNWSKWWGRWMKETLGIKDHKKAFHSFRHTFIQECREKGIPEARRNSMTGHVSKEAVDNYGGWKGPEGRYYAFSPRALKEEIELLSFGSP